MACTRYLDFCFKSIKVLNAEATSYDQWLPDNRGEWLWYFEAIMIVEHKISRLWEQS